MEDKLEKYRHMWTTDQHEYLLIEYISTITKAINYVIYHLPTKTVMLMEDDTVSEFVVDEMIKSGVPIKKEIPK